MKFGPTIFSIAALTLLAACDEPSPPKVMSKSVVSLGVNFSWDGTARCFDPASPPFAISNAPAQTASLNFRLTDLNVPQFDHGGGSIAYAGPEIPRNAFRYKGPCPPSGSHKYQWDVEALNASGVIIALGSSALPFSQQGR